MSFRFGFSIVFLFFVGILLVKKFVVLLFDKYLWSFFYGLSIMLGVEDLGGKKRDIVFFF